MAIQSITPVFRPSIRDSLSYSVLIGGATLKFVSKEYELNEEVRVNKRFEEKDKVLILAHGSIGSIAVPYLSDKFKVDFYSLKHLVKLDFT